MRTVIAGDMTAAAPAIRRAPPTDDPNATVLFWDFETRASADLKSQGATKYSLHADTGIWCIAYALADDPVSIWYEGQPFPNRILEHIETGGMVSGWNAGFEFDIWENVILRDNPTFPHLTIDQLDCTMARACASALPAALDLAAAAVGIDQRKDKEGYRIMMKMCRPTKEWRDNPVGPPVWHRNPEDLKKLGAYCIGDVEIERKLKKLINPLSARERQVWLMDRRINMRGIHIDNAAVDAALRIVDGEKIRLTRELRALTNNEVTTANSVPQILGWLKEAHGVELENLKKRRLARFLKNEGDNIPADAKRALEIRLEMARASTAKLKRMISSQEDDGGCRGLFFYCGTTTKRWSGKRIQLQNLLRPEFKGINEKKYDEVIENCFRLFDDEEHGADLIRLSYAEPMHAVASCMRGMIIPDRGNEFIGGDLTGIENRVLMWLAGEKWMLEEFRKADRGEGVDNYELTWSKISGTPVEEVTPKYRMLGKVSSLSCIAEGQLVLTDAGLVPIEEITTGHRVWDGTEFVRHDGVVFKGQKKVFEYDGLIATEDHIVWAEALGPIRFAVAASTQQRLIRTGDGGKCLRAGTDNIAEKTARENLRLRRRNMHRLRPFRMDSVRQFEGGEKSGLSQMHSSICSTMARKASGTNEGEMHKTATQGMERLWRTRNRIPIRVCERGMFVDSNKHWSASRSADRPHRQRWSLRAGKSSVRNSPSEYLELETRKIVGSRFAMGSDAKPPSCPHDRKTSPRRSFQTRDYKTGESLRIQKVFRLEVNSRKTFVTRTYDILNAGPRNRFTVSNCLVHNCGFAGAVGAALGMADNYDEFNIHEVADAVFKTTPADRWDTAREKYPIQAVWQFGLDEYTWTAMRVVVDGWRSAHPNVVQLWWDLKDAAIEAVQNKGKPVILCDGKLKLGATDQYLKIRVPSGGFLTYARPSIVESEFIDSKGQKRQRYEVRYYGLDKKTKRRWEPRALTAQILSENVSSFTAREVLVDAMLRLEARGYPISMHVHDECVAEKRKNTGDKEEYRAIMCDSASWLGDLPIAAKTWKGMRFEK